jgi:MYXO-CTERM domain-containing protein
MRLFLLTLVVLGLAPRAQAASGACDAVTTCATGQTCVLPNATAATGQCQWVVTTQTELVNAINAANADAARDVIVLGGLDLTEPFVIPLETTIGTDPELGPLALPIISSAITVVGGTFTPDVDVTLDINADHRLFVLRPSTTTNFQPDLLLQKLVVKGARPGANGAGDVVGAGGVHVTGVATTGATPALPLFAAEDVTFTNCRGGSAGAVSLEAAAPARLARCTFDGNSSTEGASAVSTATSLTITSCTFQGNDGATATVEALAPTRVDETGAAVDVTLQVFSSTFVDNNGGLSGGVRSLAESAQLTNDTFRNNAARDGNIGGAVAARNLRVSGGTFDGNFAPGGGGAVALLDEPVSGLARIAGAFFQNNVTPGRGGAVLSTTVPVSIADNVFLANAAGSGGGAVALGALAERNGAEPDGVVQNNLFDSNVARPTATIVSADATLDELGNDTGHIELTLRGGGSALLVENAVDVEARNNCFLGNGAAAVQVVLGSVDATGNFWGAADGPAPNGGGDLALGADTTLNTADFLNTPPSFCANDSGEYPRFFLNATVTADSARVVEDFDVVDASRGFPVLSADAGVLIVDMRTGAMSLDVVGKNDADTEGNESFTLALTGCTDDACDRTGQNEVQFVITDNGDGVVAGEGEGEGEACDETVAVSPPNLILEDTGEPTSATLTVTNTSACAIQLIRPLMQSGASQGFSVDPVLQDKLALEPGAKLELVVRYTPPEDDDTAADEPPTGTLVIESRGGALVEVGILLEQGCSCATSKRAPPGELALVAVAAVVVLRRRRR